MQGSVSRMKRVAALGVVLILAGCGTKPVACDVDAPTDQIWIATRVNVEGVQQVNARVASRFFDSPDSYIIEGWETFPWYNRSSRTGYWPSASAFALAVRDYPEQVRSLDAAVYDPEPWASTPASEQQDPVAAMRAFAEDARGADLAVVLTPEVTLVDVEDAVCARGHDETVEDAFLRCRIAASAAEVADVVEIQAQSLQGNPEAYRAFLLETVAQVHQANADAKVISGLTVRSEDEVTQAKQAWTAVDDVVDGHYISMDAVLGERFLAWVDSCSGEPSTP